MSEAISAVVLLGAAAVPAAVCGYVVVRLLRGRGRRRVPGRVPPTGE